MELAQQLDVNFRIGEDVQHRHAKSGGSTVSAAEDLENGFAFSVALAEAVALERAQEIG